MIINHNLSALNTYRKSSYNSNTVTKSLEKLSSGLAINQASDNAAGLAISEKMRGQIRGLDQASTNATDTISLIQTAEGALSETHSALQRIRELSVQAASDTNTDLDRYEIQKEVDQLVNSIDSISNYTEFNTKKLLNGSLKFQSGSSAIAPTAKLYVDPHAYGTFIEEPVTIDDGWVIQGGLGVKIRINPDEQIQEDGTYVGLVYKDNGILTGFSILTLPNYPSYSGATSIINTRNETPPVLSYRFNGVNVDVSDFSLELLINGSIGFGTFQLYAGHNGSPAIPEINNSLYTHIGANTSQNIKLDINDMGSNSLGVDLLNLRSRNTAESAISTVDTAISLVSAERGKLGAVHNRLEHAIANNNISSENLSSSESRIRDIDMASEMMQYTKANIIFQASQSMLAQANHQPENVLQLLQ